jgi:putative membrane protein
MYPGKNGYKQKKSPEDILGNRFAKGEISEKENEEQKRLINSKNKYDEILFQHNPKG